MLKFIHCVRKNLPDVDSEVISVRVGHYRNYSNLAAKKCIVDALFLRSFLFVLYQ